MPAPGHLGLIIGQITPIEDGRAQGSRTTTVTAANDGPGLTAFSEGVGRAIRGHLVDDLVEGVVVSASRAKVTVEFPPDAST